MQKTAIAAALTLASLGANAAAQDIISLTITGGDFSMGAPGVGACDPDPATFTSFRCLTGGSTTPMIMGTYQSASLTAFQFFGGAVNTFTAASAAGAAPNPTGAPSGTVDGGVMTVDLGGWYAEWNGTNFSQGTKPGGDNGSSVAATGTYDANTGAFDISWNSYITTAPFADKMGYWHLTGTAEIAAVPVPAAVWLFGSGLVGLAGIARRRKAA